MLTPSRPPARRLRIFGVCILTVAAACSRDTSSPDPSVIFIKQPTTATAGEPIQPPVEVMVRDASGGALSGTVTLALEPNPCEWHLAGTLAVEVIDSTARFGDLALDKVGRGYTLRASSDGASTMSAPFGVRSGIVTEPVVLENVLCLKPNPQGDGESLTYIPEDDMFWIADDNQESIFEVDRRTGAYGSQITLDMILAALPDAGQCDDGDGDPDTECSYVSEFELLAYDPVGRILYVANSVNTPTDRPAIFRLTKGGCAGCFTPDSWQPLSVGPSYRSVIVVAGQLYLALGDDIYAYDYDTNELATVDEDGDSLPPTYSTPSSVVALSFDGTHMWILTRNRVLHQVEWVTRSEVQNIELDAFGFSLPRGLEIVNDTIYVLEGDVPNPIYVLSQR
jgi:hypothetical protein